MFFCETACSNNTNRHRSAGGQALIAALGVIVVLGILVSLALSVADFTKGSTTREGRSQQALQAADSAVNQYVGRLVEDPYYYLHYVDNAEDTRIVGGSSYAAGDDFRPTGSFQWTYGTGVPTKYIPLEKDADNVAVKGSYGYVDYSLRVRPSPDGLTTRITATGRVGGTGPGAVTRSVEATIKPQSVSDFQLISDGSQSYSSITTGKLYVINGNLTMNAPGFAEGSVYADGRICAGSCAGGVSNIASSRFNTAATNPKREYIAGDTAPKNFSQRWPSPVDFTLFSVDNQNTRAFAAGANTLWADPSVGYWMIQFYDDGSTVGKYNLWKMTTWNQWTGAATGRTPVVLGASLPDPISVLYFDQPVVIGDYSWGGKESEVNGRVTVASKGEVFFGGNVKVKSHSDDVLGVIAGTYVTLARTLPPDTEIWSSIIGQGETGQTKTFRVSMCSGTGGLPPLNTLHFHGSEVEKGACIGTQYPEPDAYTPTRFWDWDENRKNLVPPLYPVLPGSYEISNWREVKTPGT